MVGRSRISRPLVAALKPIHRVFLPSYFRIVLRHAGRLPRSGPMILAPSHRSKWDSLVLAYLTGEPLRFLASRHEFVGVQGWFLRRLGAFPINRDSPTPGPLRHAVNLVVAAGEPLVVYPEGTIRRDRPEQVHPLKRGAAWIALAAQARCPDVAVSLVPIWLDYEGRRARFRGRIEVVVGQPILVAPYLSYPRKEGTLMLTAKLRDSLGEAAPSPTDGTPDRASGEPRDARAWFRSLDPGQRSAIRVLHQISPSWNLVLLLYPALWLASATVAVMTPSWPARLACYAVSGVAIHAMATLMHEGIHGTLFRRRRLDRLAGFLLGAPAMFSFTAYKVAHLVHHRHTRTELDPDDFLNVSPNRLIRSVVFYGWLGVGMLAYLLHIPIGALRLGTPRERKAIVLEYAVIFGVIAAALVFFGWIGRLDIPLHAWLLPLPVAIAFGNMRSWAEHALTRPGHPLTQTRTVTSNRAVSFLMCNLNYHLEHHLFPGVPWYNLPKLHALLLDEYRRAGAIVHRSYLGFLREAALAGVHGTTAGSAGQA